VSAKTVSRLKVKHTLSASENLGSYSSCECGGKLVRVRRRPWQRLLYSAVYRCGDCGEVRVRRSTPTLFSTKSRCPRCGTPRLRVLRKRDGVDEMSSSFWSFLQRIFGAELHHCEYCRLQFYDFRGVAPKETKKPES
jgi:uncharacterized protein with PIN domain